MNSIFRIGSFGFSLYAVNSSRPYTGGGGPGNGGIPGGMGGNPKGGIGGIPGGGIKPIGGISIGEGPGGPEEEPFGVGSRESIEMMSSLFSECSVFNFRIVPSKDLRNCKNFCNSARIRRIS